MKRIFIPMILCAMATFSCANTQHWHDVKEPKAGNAIIYGGYSAGCLAGAKMLDETGKGYVLARPERERAFGHPALIAFIKDYAAAMSERGLTLMVSDVGQARGGPAPLTSAHQSHQTGLDVDLWYSHAIGNDTTITTPYAVGRSFDPEVTKDWLRFAENHVTLLKEASLYDEVQRIFVTPSVKQYLCKHHREENWIRKIRPWWGHARHFHIRLRCPEGSKHCEPQDEPESVACDDTLAWWFSNDARETAAKASGSERTYPTLPKQCQSVLSASQ